MIYEHLNNQNTHQKLDKNLDHTIMKKKLKTIKQKQKYFPREEV